MKTIGIDFGNTIVRNVKHHLKKPFPDALRVIKNLTAKHKVYIISKVDARQKEEVIRWMVNNDFYSKTGVLIEDVYFCAERSQKGQICHSLGVNHMVDDRPEVMAFVDYGTECFLFRPEPKDVVKWYSSLTSRRVIIVNNWKKIEILLL